jgi:hypothetical protein
MTVRGTGRGGKAGGARGASGPGAAAKAQGTSFGNVDKAQSLVGPSGAAGSSNVGLVGSADPVTAQALELVRQLKAGQIKSKEEATRRLVADILRDKVHTQSKHLAAKVFESLSNDPRMNQTLERLWKQAEDGE